MSTAGIVMDNSKEEEGETIKKEDQAEETIYEKYTIKELQKLLQKSIENEEYEKASQIRDEINRRKEK